MPPSPSSAFGVLRALGGRRPSPPRGAVVLAYHDVVPGPDDRRVPLDVTVDELAAHLAVVAATGHEVVPLVELVDRLADDRSVDGLLAVTFDDALSGVTDHALEVLAAAGAPATIFVVADHLGTDAPWWPEVGCTSTPATLRALGDVGVTLGSHTRTHPSLPPLDDDALVDELATSATLLSELADAPVEHLAYPSGHHDARVRRAASAAGYRSASTFLNGRVTSGTDPLRIPRLTMGEHHGRLRFAEHLCRRPQDWPDHQLDAVTAAS